MIDASEPVYVGRFPGEPYSRPPMMGADLLDS
jgi:hypothetical protein